MSVIAGVLTATVVPPSDGRLKKDIKDSPYGLAQLLKLRPVSYRWKSTTEDPGVQVGLIAQEVRGVVPEVIHTDGSTGMLAVNYNGLLPVVINAIKQQQTMIQQQQATIERQEARIEALERTMAKAALSAEAETGARQARPLP